MITSFRSRLTLLFGAVLLVFGLFADHLARDELRRALGAKLERRGVAIARDLAAMSSDAIFIGDTFGLLRILERTKANNPDTRYVILVDAKGKVLASTFGTRMPRGLLKANTVTAPEPWRLKRFTTEEGIVRDIAVPMAAMAGTVRVGISDESLVSALAGYSFTLSVTLAALLLAGLLLSYGLAGFLTRPLNELISAVRSVGRGNLAETIPSPGRDEVGELALEFNAMTRSLGEKEAMRQALLEKVITTQEDERKRVARDLHDDLAQSLAYVLMRLEQLESRVARTDEDSQAILGQAREVLGASLVQMRRLIGDLRPTILDDLGLVAALRCHAESHLRPLGCRIDFEANDLRTLPPLVETAVFRIIQEAINNIARHAGAKSATIALRTTSDSLTGEVADDGCGFSSSHSRPRVSELSGLGLQGMRERASLLGGSLSVSETEQGGTLVTFEVPLGTRRAG